MKTLSLSLKFFVLAVFTFALASTAQAQVRTWVSGDGNDFDPCSRTAPCRTFAGAIGKTSAGGEINVVDAGSYGTVSIAKSITIDGNGFVAAITATISNGVNINGDMADTVTLRNLSINGQFAAFNGINYTATTNGSQLVLENVTIERMGTSGIFVQGGSAANPLLVEINNCQLNNNFVGIQQRQHSAVNHAQQRHHRPASQGGQLLRREHHAAGGHGGFYQTGEQRNLLLPERTARRRH